MADTNNLTINWNARHIAPLIILAVWLILPVQGHCADGGGDPHGLNAMTDSIVKTIFSPWVRRSILAFGGGFGVFQSISAGSWKPLLVWGGLGLTVNYVPKMIELLST